MAVVGGVPEIFTVEPEVPVCTVMLNHLTAELTPSYAWMPISEYFPTLLAPGVPDSFPVVVLKVAQTGFPVIEKASLRPAESVAVGVKA